MLVCVDVLELLYIYSDKKLCIREDNSLRSWQLQLSNNESNDSLALSEVCFEIDNFQTARLSSLIRHTSIPTNNFMEEGLPFVLNFGKCFDTVDFPESHCVATTSPNRIR